MKVLILAAGYGTRLARDLERTGECPELKGVPKPLLPIAGRPLISHWMEIIRSCPRTRDAEVYIVVCSSCALVFGGLGLVFYTKEWQILIF